MTTILAQADTAFLLSVTKPVVFTAALGGWAWVVSQLDKDAGFFYLKRRLFNLAHLLTGVIGFGLMLLLPIFWVGLPVGLIVAAVSIVGYVYFRNSQVPPGQEWTLSLESFQKRVQQMQHASAQNKATLKLRTTKGVAIDVPATNHPGFPAHHAFESMLAYALPRGADTIELAVDPEKTKLSVRIDGVRYAQDPPDPKLAVQTIDYVKKAVGLDVEDRRRKQAGRIVASTDEGIQTELEVLVAGSTRGMQMQVVVDPDKTAEMPLGLLGLLPKQQQYLESILAENKRVVLLATDKHQGGPTTMYALIHHIDPYVNSVITIEEDQSIELEGVDRHIIERATPATEFNNQLGVIIRSDPNVVMLYRIADADTLKLVAGVGADMRFLMPLPQDDATKALRTYVKAVNDPKLAANSLATVIAQRLVRRLCTTCRVPYSPDPAAIKKLNLPADKVGTLYRGSGKVLVKEREQECPDCHGMGYRGRVGVFEVMPIDDAARGYVAAGKWDELKTHLRKHGMIYLQEAALAKVVEGLTDIKEVQRVLSSSGKDD